MNKNIFLMVAIFSPICSNFSFASSFSDPIFISCPNDPLRQTLRSNELQAIVSEDQKDRMQPVDLEKIDWAKVLPRDESRRKRIGEIFGEGCFKEAKDYAAAALVYQHGVIPDHYFQTFLWAKKAVELGDPSQKWLMAAGIDRYLVNTGHKQLFATQAAKIDMNDECYCLEEVEKSFPEKIMVSYTKKTLKDALEWVDSLNHSLANCKPTPVCKKNLKSSPAGTVPGFW